MALCLEVSERQQQQQQQLNTNAEVNMAGKIWCLVTDSAHINKIYFIYDMVSCLTVRDRINKIKKQKVMWLICPNNGR